MLQTIIYDRDSIFIGAFWKEFMKSVSVRLNFSTARHPQTDGQTKVANCTLETYVVLQVTCQPKLLGLCLAIPHMIEPQS